MRKWDVCKSSGPGIELRISWEVEFGYRLFWEEKHLMSSLSSRAVFVQFCSVPGCLEGVSNSQPMLTKSMECL